jgi:hypothetical protein
MVKFLMYKENYWFFVEGVLYKNYMYVITCI